MVDFPDGVIVEEDTPQIDQPEGMVVFEEEGSDALLPKDAENKAAKNHVALGPMSPGKEQLFDSIVSQNDDQNRQAMGAEFNAGKRNRQLQLVDNYINTRRKIGPVDRKEIQYLLSLTGDKQDELVSNPKTFFEKLYAEKVVTEATNGENSEFNQTLAENPENAGKLRSATESIIAKTESFRNLEGKYSKIWEDAGFVSSALNYAGQIAPFVSWWNTQNAVEGATSAFLQGNNIKEQIEFIWLHPHDEALDLAEKALEDIAENGSKLDALKFAQALTSYSAWEGGLDNLLGVVDITTGRGGVLVSKQIRNLVLGVHNPKAATKETIANIKGEVADASFEKVKTRLDSNADRVRGKVNSLEEIREDTMPLMDPDRILDDIDDNISREFTQRLTDQLKTNSAELIKSGVFDPVRIATLEGDALKIAQDSAVEAFRKNYPNLENAVLSVKPTTGLKTKIGTDAIDVILGKANGTLFSSKNNAEMHARFIYGLRDGGYTAIKHGDKWKLAVTRQLDSTLPSVRQQLAIQTQNDPVVSFSNLLFGRVRGNDYVLPKKIVSAFKTATLGGNGMNKAMKSVGRQISVLKGQSKEDFGKFLHNQRTFVDPENPERVGKFSNTLGEFSDDWHNAFNRAPTEQETLAYFAHRQLNDIDYMINNLGMYRDKVRTGLSNVRIKIDGKTQGDKIEGKQLDSIPWDRQDNIGIVQVDNTAGSIKGRKKDWTSRNAREEIDRLVSEEGYKVFEISPTGEKSFRSMVKELPDANLQNMDDITILVVKDGSTTPLDFKQIPYRAGGHVIYKNGFFVKQGIVRRATGGGGRVSHTYEGDISLFNFQSRAQGKQITEALEKGRQMLRDGANPSDLKAFVTNNLPMEVAEFTRLFSKNGPLSLNQPIVLTQANQSTDAVVNYSKSLPNFKNRGDSDLYNQVNTRFAQKRGQILDTVINTGTQESPVFSTRQAELIDPASAIDRALGQVARGRQLDDAKFKTAEQFTAQFRDVIDFSDPRTNNNSVATLLEGKLIEDTPNRQLLAAAKNYRRSAKELLGVRSEFHKTWDRMRFSVADSIYERLGQDRLKRIQSYLLTTESNPINFFRGIAFHEKLGLFNPVQLFQQAQTWVHIAAVAGPGRALTSSAAGMLMRSLEINPNMLKNSAKMAAKFGWSEPDFIESFNALQKSGFNVVGREVSELNDVFGTPSIVNRSGLGNFLEAGTVFFKEGEKFTRLTAWNAAYRAWKKANNGKPLDDAGAREVLDRADTLTLNMTRASMASWQHGVLSIPTQFMSYQTRLMEQMLTFGKQAQLTPGEKLRVLATYSAFYGVPVAAGAPAAGVWPFHEEIRKGLLERGIDVEQNLITKALNDGMVSMVTEMATGERLNFGERLGPTGNSIFRDLWRGDKGIAEIVGGASGVSTVDTITTAFPLAVSAATVLSDDDAWYPIAAENVVNFMNNISSFNQGRHMYNAIFLGKYIDKTGKNVTDVDGWSGAFGALTGLTPQSIAEMYSLIELDKDLREHQKDHREQIIKLYRMALQAKDDDTEIALKEKVKLHWIAGGFRPSQWRTMMKDIGDSLGNTLDQYEQRKARQTAKDWEFFIKRIKRREDKRKERQ